MRAIALDTETTGLEPKSGHRIIEIGCVELVNAIPTGEVFHTYINPQRDIPEVATRISGITEEMVRNSPFFSDMVSSFLNFLGDSPLVIHNAKFDMGFINYELGLLSLENIEMARAIDTLHIARTKFPGSPASLDALCRRFNIDLSGRVKHGALIDAQLLSEVYLHLLGGRQHAFGFKKENREAHNMLLEVANKNYKEPRIFSVSDIDLKAHKKMLAKLKNPLWGLVS